MSAVELSEQEERFLVLLESSHDFPGPYTFKLIYRSAPGLEDRLVERICESVGLPRPEDPPTLRRSGAGRFVSMSLELPIPSARRVLDVYRTIGELDEVVSYF